MRLLATFLLLLSGLAAAQDTSHIGDDVRALLTARCASCHGEALRKPKGRFGFVEDLSRVAEEYVVPGELLESDLWYSLTDPDEPMPPLDAEEPQLTLAELGLVRWWIEDGAKPPKTPRDELDAAAADAPTSESGAPAVPAPGAGPWKRRAARTHPVVVHFPIALLFAAFLAELLGVVRGVDRWRPAVGFCLVAGTLGCLAAVASGWLLAPVEGYGDDTVFAHRWLGVAATVAAVLAAATFRRGGVLHRLLLLAAVVLAGLAGHDGGILVHGADYFA